MSDDETNGTRCRSEYEYTVAAIDCDWDSLEGHMEHVIHEHQSAGHELVFVNGPTFERGTHMVLTFRRRQQ